MSALMQFLKSVLPHIRSEHERDEAYLAASVDVYDLERRMRELDQRGRSQGLVPAVGSWSSPC